MEHITRAELEQAFPKGVSKAVLALNSGCAEVAATARVVAPATTMTKPKAHKYRAQPTVVDGIRFASKRESERYQQLKAMEKAGEITHLELQPDWDLKVNNIKVCRYVGDFSYRRNGTLIIEDVKGFRTPVYKLKKKLFEACYNLKITEV